jgi:hypothetical protein
LNFPYWSNFKQLSLNILTDFFSGGNGDGFTFFVSRTLPKIGILSSFGNGLGIAKHDNTLVLGYSAFYEEFRKCKW